MTYIPPFTEDANAYADSGSSAISNRQQDPSCTTAQDALDSCFDTNGCEGNCDVPLTSILASDCKAAHTWTCALEWQCVVCREDIFDLLECYDVPTNCAFGECTDLPLPPSLAGYLTTDGGALAPPPSSPSPIASPATSSPTDTQTSPAFTPVYSPAYSPTASEPTTTAPPVDVSAEGTWSPSLLAILAVDDDELLPNGATFGETSGAAVQYHFQQKDTSSLVVTTVLLVLTICLTLR